MYVQSGRMDYLLLQWVHHLAKSEYRTQWSRTIVLKGGIQVGSDQTENKQFYTVVLSADEKENGVQLTAIEDGTELMMAAGEPLDQEVVQYGPFVMTSREEVRKTLMDCG